jgi:hypothetical protein
MGRKVIILSFTSETSVQKGGMIKHKLYNCQQEMKKKCIVKNNFYICAELYIIKTRVYGPLVVHRPLVRKYICIVRKYFYEFFFQILLFITLSTVTLGPIQCVLGAAVFF